MNNIGQKIISIGLILIFLFSGFASSALTCPELLLGSATVTDWVVTRHLNYTRQIRTSFSRNGFDIEHISNTEENDVLFGQNMPGAFLSQSYQSGRRYQDVVQEVTQFAISQYGRREWSEKFKESLIAKALRADVRSDYVIVRRNGQIVGSIRLTFSPYQVFIRRNSGEVIGATDIGVFPSNSAIEQWIAAAKPEPLPAEISLKKRAPRPPMIRLDRTAWLPLALENARRYHNVQPFELGILETAFSGYDLAFGVLVEPASFAISKTLSPDEVNQVFAQLIAGMARLLSTYSFRGPIAAAQAQGLGEIRLPFNVGTEKPMFVTYGDALSVRFYKSLGYEASATPTELANGDKGWYILFSSADKYIEAIRRISTRLAKGGVDADLIMDSVRQTFASANILEWKAPASGPFNLISPLEDKWYYSYPR